MSQGIAFNRAAQLHPFLKAFERRGGIVGPVLEAAGLEHFDLSDPTTLITGNSLYRAVQDMSDTLDDPFFLEREPRRSSLRPAPSSCEKAMRCPTRLPSSYPWQFSNLTSR